MNHPDYLRHLNGWLRDRDPIRSRMAVNNHAYGFAIQTFKRTTRRIPERVLDVLAAVLVGMVIGVLLSWRG